MPTPGELWRARNFIHAAFDPLWLGTGQRTGQRIRRGRGGARIRSRRDRAQRVRCYAWLADRLGLDPDGCHFGRMDMATLSRAYEIVSAFRREHGVRAPAEIRRWYENGREKP